MTAHGQDEGSLDVFEGHHRGLRELLETLARAIDGEEASQDQVVAAVEAVEGFARSHFADEEKFMEDVSYPWKGDHQQQHREFLRWMQQMRDLAGTDFQALVRQHPARSLTDWWEQHALLYDRQLAEFLCRGGV